MKCLGLVAFSLVCPIAVYAILSKLNAKLKKKSGDIIIDMPDIISGLPDDILVLISSRLSAKDVVRTSVLSRRWRNHHGLVPIHIDSDSLSRCFRTQPFIVLLYRFLLYRFFDHPGPYYAESIIALVHRFLRGRSRIHSIRLEICLIKSVNDEFELCINHLGRLGLEELALTCTCGPDFTNICVSLQLLSQIPSLRYLQLNSCYLTPNLTSQCKSLETLDLYCVRFLPGAMECILSNYLRLHKLILEACTYPSKLCFCGPSLQLKSLHIKYGQGVEEIEFYATNLVLFEFKHVREVKFIFDHVPSLENIYIGSQPNNIMPYVAGKLTGNLPHVKSLNLTTGVDMFQGRKLRGMTMFSNLKRLDIRILHTKNMNLLLLISFLHSFPHLEEFHVYTQHLKYDVAQREDHHRVVFHSMLKKMEICGFGGTESEIVFALHILKGAINLEKMLISRCSKEYNGFESWWYQYGPPWSESTRTNIHQRLQGQAVSNKAQLIIQHEIDLEG